MIRRELYIARLDFKTLPKIAINGSPLEFVTKVKNLGVILSSTLDFHAQVNAVVSKVFYSILSLHFFKNSLSRQLRIQLVRSLVFPYLDFTCVTYPGVDKTCNNKLQTAKNACVSFVIDSVPLGTHITPHRL